MIGSYVALSFYLFGNILDVLISIERLSMFSIRFKKLEKLNPFLTAIVTFTTCYVINMPIAFRTYIKGDDEIKYDLVFSLKNGTPFYICGNGILHDSSILIGLNLILRDIMPLIMEILFSILIIIKFKRFKNVKDNLSRGVLYNVKSNNNSIESNNISLKKESTQNKKLTIMTFYLSVASIISHLTIFFGFLLFLLQTDDTIIGYIIMLAVWSITAKHSSNFFIFYKFNSNFENVLSRKLNIRSNQVENNLMGNNLPNF